MYNYKITNIRRKTTNLRRKSTNRQKSKTPSIYIRKLSKTSTA